MDDMKVSAWSSLGLVRGKFQITSWIDFDWSSGERGIHQQLNLFEFLKVIDFDQVVKINGDIDAKVRKPSPILSSE
ncbi:UNVERIFIED_CONTAM: hypothetical protein K2H54_055557 [Gekko kuhli]